MPIRERQEFLRLSRITTDWERWQRSLRSRSLLAEYTNSRLPRWCLPDTACGNIFGGAPQSRESSPYQSGKWSLLRRSQDRNHQLSKLAPGLKMPDRPVPGSPPSTTLPSSVYPACPEMNKKSPNRMPWDNRYGSYGSGMVVIFSRSMSSPFLYLSGGSGRRSTLCEIRNGKTMPGSRRCRRSCCNSYGRYSQILLLPRFSSSSGDKPSAPRPGRCWLAGSQQVGLPLWGRWLTPVRLVRLRQ
jgi:hypothetical protein